MGSSGSRLVAANVIVVSAMLASQIAGDGIPIPIPEISWKTVHLFAHDNFSLKNLYSIDPGIFFTVGAVAGPLFLLVVTDFGRVLDSRSDRHTGDRPLFRFCGHEWYFWMFKVMFMSVLALVDEVTDVFATLSFFNSGQMGFFHASLGALIFSSAANALSLS